MAAHIWSMLPHPFQWAICSYLDVEVSYLCLSSTKFRSFTVSTIPVHSAIFDMFTGSVIRAAAIQTSGAAGPSGIDAHDWRRLFLSLLCFWWTLFCLSYPGLLFVYYNCWFCDNFSLDGLPIASSGQEHWCLTYWYWRTVCHIIAKAVLISIEDTQFAANSV